MQPTSNPAPSTRQVSFAISGMSCGHCVAAVTDALGQLPGVEVRSVAVGAATVAIDPATASTDALVAAIRDAGYDARVAARPLPQSAGTTCCAPSPD